MTKRNDKFVPLRVSYPDSEKINKVSIDAEAFFVRLLTFSDDYGHFWATPRLLLGKVWTKRWVNRQVSVKKVTRWLKELVDDKLIQLYEVEGVEYLQIVASLRVIRKDVKPDIRFPTMPGMEVTGRMRNEDVTCPKQFRPPNLIQSNLIKKPLPLTGQGGVREKSPKRKTAKEYPADFQAFWKAYPRKVGIKSAFKEWKKAKDKPPLDDILEAIELQKKSTLWQKDEGEWIVHPERWLKRGQWADKPKRRTRQGMSYPAKLSLEKTMKDAQEARETEAKVQAQRDAFAKLPKEERDKWVALVQKRQEGSPIRSSEKFILGQAAWEYAKERKNETK